MRGGYNQVDLSGVDLTSGDVFTKSGIYKTIRECQDKPILYYNIVSGYTKLKPMFLTTLFDEPIIYIEVRNRTLAVNPNDEITIS